MSVIMPVYNQEKYVRETIKSVLAQSFENFEFIIVDDGSGDRSGEIINEFFLKDTRIVPLFINNSGKPKAVAAAVEAAKGTFLAFIDHDDLMAPDRLKKQVEFHEKNPNVHGTSSHCFYIDKDGRTIGKQRYLNLLTIDDSKRAITDKKLVFCAFSGLMVYKHSFLKTGGLRSQFWPCDDLDFFNRFIESGFNLIVIQEFLMKYRIHSAQSSAKNQWLFDMTAYAGFCTHLRRKGDPEISFSEFKKIRKNDSLWIRFKRKAHYLSLIYHQKAGFALYTKKYAVFLYLFTVATILDPAYVYASVKNKFKN